MARKLLLLSSFSPSLVADCNSLSNLSNGLVSVADSDAVGVKLASYSCLDGYELIGDATRMCTESGLWSGAEPLCEGTRQCSLIGIQN